MLRPFSQGSEEDTEGFESFLKVSSVGDGSLKLPSFGMYCRKELSQRLVNLAKLVMVTSSKPCTEERSINDASQEYNKE